MLRTARAAAAVLAAAALVSLPATATAADYNGPKAVVNNVNQFALGDIFNAGHDNIVGSNDGAVDLPGVGVGAFIFKIAVDPGVPFMVNTGSTGFEWPPYLSESTISRVAASGMGQATYEGSPGTNTSVTLRVDPAGRFPLTCETSSGLICEVNRGDEFLIRRR